MPNMPAVCPNGHVFASGINIVEDATGVGFEGTVAGPCPVCGEDGIVPNGTYDSFGSTIQVARGHSLDDLQRLVGILEAADPDASADEVADAIEAADASLAPFAALIRELRENWRFWLVIFVTIFGSDVRNMVVGSEQPPSTDEVIERVGDELQKRQNMPVPQPATVDQRRVQKVGRNDPCPCGSGQKYKRCHGAPEGVPAR